MDLYTELFQKTGADKYWLRSTVGSTSCKLSALMYIVIHLLIDKIGKVSIENIPALTKKILQLDYPHIETMKTILMNRAVGGERIEDVHFLEGVRKLWYVGLVKPSKDIYVEGNIIDHYFLIVRKGDEFQIVSSYGCDRVYMKQYITDLVISEFDAFIVALREHNPEIIRSFIKKYFLDVAHYVKKSVDPDENDGRASTDPALTSKEVEEYVTSEYHLEHFPIPVILQGLVEYEVGMLGGMRKKKTRKGKRKHYVRSRNRRYSFYQK